MLAVRLPEDIEARLSALATATGRSKSFYVREALIEQLADLEDYYLATDRLARITSGASTTIPLETLIAEYGLED